MNSSDHNALSIVSESPLNAETPPSAWLQELTPNSHFYIRNHFDIPELEAPTWALKISGEVEQTTKFTLDEIKTWPKISERVLLECAGNGRTVLTPPIAGTNWGFGAVAQAEFSGTPLKELIERVQPSSNCVEVLFVGADFGKVRTGEDVPYARSMPVEATLDEDVILCWEMNGEELPREHGYPLRLLVPGRYGMSSVKWLSEIRFLDEVFEGFFQVEDYVYVQAEGKPNGAPVGPMRVRSLIASHAEGQKIEGGKQRVRGITWSGEGNIEQVLVSIDGGESWKKATLEPDPNVYTWTSWSLEVTFPHPGEFELLSRATDSAGNQQPMEQYWNKGGYGNNVVQRVRVRVIPGG